MATELNSSIPRESVTHVKLGEVTFELDGGQLIGVRAIASFGRETGEEFTHSKSVEVFFDRDQVNSSLTAAEKQALGSIRDKILTAAIARVT